MLPWQPKEHLNHKRNLAMAAEQKDSHPHPPKGKVHNTWNHQKKPLINYQRRREFSHATTAFRVPSNSLSMLLCWRHRTRHLYSSVSITFVLYSFWWVFTSNRTKRKKEGKSVDYQRNQLSVQSCAKTIVRNFILY